MITRQPSEVNMLDRITSLASREPFDIDHFNTVRERCNVLTLSDDQLKEVMARLEQSFVEGLHPDTVEKAAVKMHPSYIRATSVGQERGKFMALDLGGSNFRVLLITLHGGKKSDMVTSTFCLPKDVQQGTGEKLFDHVAECLAQFLDEHKMEKDTSIPLGFTFSFPCRQDGLTSASLVAWTKGFTASGVVGNDVVKLLQEACHRKGIGGVNCVALINDTVGTMLACSFFDHTCSVGLIVGTGSNACYMERLENIPKLKGLVNAEQDGLPPEMCINCEYGAFGDDGKLEPFLTDFDRALDKASLNPGRQTFEKTISGMYLGELVRLVLVDLVAAKLLFQQSNADSLQNKDSFSTRILSEVERYVLEAEKPLHKIGLLLADIGVSAPTPTDCAIVAHLCSLISGRSSNLCAAGMATILRRMDRKHVAIGVDGSVYKAHPTFKDLLSRKIDALTDGRHEFKLVLSEDGSGRGAAVAAAVAERMMHGDEGKKGKKEGGGDEKQQGLCAIS